MNCPANDEGPTENLQTEAEDALRIAVGVAIMLGPERIRALLALSDARLGEQFKLGLSQAVDLAGQATFGRDELVSHNKKRVRRGRLVTTQPEKNSAAFNFDRRAIPSHQALVDSGELLLAATIWKGLEITRQALNKAVTSGRIFTVDVGATQYYPAFYLSTDVDRKTLAKVTRLLGDLPGWSKWQFFTTPKASLGNITPLIALSRGKFEQVAKVAAAFMER
ncbi:hypothetical protein [Pandoraea apista]|uniref:hypothetical protein n=1 Tax=Pandoraea apista TaxID=93218 RepID=UPI00058A84FF|nr:hypothetical protein [Pandoraea apista]AJE98834.1 hypothetical protein SG18_12710 [Pandoraea apista]AKH72914.1 hypothetical protein XM39_12910 [Pandoraea apista]AKI61299.1 hypothetical protein AA956_05165 [Pandoraea apista]